MQNSQICIPKLNANDEAYTLIQKTVPDGSYVTSGAVIAQVETTKTVVEIVAPVSGYAIFYKDVRTKVLPGEVIGYISDRTLPSGTFAPTMSTNQKRDSNYARFTDAALELIKEKSINPDEFDKYEYVTADDVKKYLSNEESENSNSAELNDTREKVVILGGRGTARMIIEILRQQNLHQIIGILDNNIPQGDQIDGVTVLGGDEKLRSLLDIGVKKAILAHTNVATGSLKRRAEKYYELKKLGYGLQSVIHDKAMIEPTAILGEGSIVLSGAIIGSHARLGPINFVNTGSVVSHETIAGENNHFAPGCVIAGQVKIGKNNLIGMNATVYMGLTIGDDNILKNGANIFASVGDHTVLS